MRKKEALMLLQMIQEAAEWLLSLAEPREVSVLAATRKSMRVFTEDECESLSLPCRRFLLALEQQGIVDSALRERIIHYAMQLQTKNIDLQVLEGITRIILSRHPEHESALSRMELLLTETGGRSIH